MIQSRSNQRLHPLQKYYSIVRSECENDLHSGAIDAGVGDDVRVAPAARPLNVGALDQLARVVVGQRDP